MNQVDLVRRVQEQQQEIAILKDQVASYQGNNYEFKYKKALKEISGVIKANSQLKDELMKYTNNRQAQNDNLNSINKEEIEKAVAKMRRQIIQIQGEKQNLELQNRKLKYSLASLEEKSNNDKNLQLGEKDIDFRLKNGDRPLENKQEIRRTLQNYEDRDAHLAATNRKLEQQKQQLQNQLYRIEQQLKNRLNQKDVELKVCRSSVREQFQSQISSLKRQITQLTNANVQLQERLHSFAEERRNFGEGTNQYEEQLIQTLRELRNQIDPMTAQILSLQSQSDFERQQIQRQKANLQIKVIEYQSEIERIRESYRILQQKLIKQSQKTRKMQQNERNMLKIEQQNRMLGGRVIVLEANQVALRNRSGNQLQQRVFEFQTRVEMLLNDKETLSNIKNVSIHQLVALKAYIMELDAKLKQVVNENQYAVKKYKSYKQKCSQLNKQLKQHDFAINALKGKLQGYDKLVVKLQGELQRAINVNESEMKSFNLKINETSGVSIEVYKKRYESLLEKLNLQEKYAEQEIQTIKLNYDTKIIDLNLKLQEFSSVRETIGLYKSKNEELSSKLTQKQNELLQSKMNKLASTDKSSFSTVISQDKNLQVISLQSENRQLKQKIADLQSSKYSSLQVSSNANFEYNQTSSKTTHLQFQIDDLRTKLHMENNRNLRLEQQNTALTQNSHQLQMQINRQTYQIQRIKRQFQSDLEEKDSQIRRISAFSSQNANKNQDNSRLNNLQVQLQQIQQKLRRVQSQRTKFYNLNIELQEKISQKQTEINRINRQLNKVRFESSSQIEQVSQIKQQYQSKINRLTNQNTSLHEQIQNKQKQVSKLTSQIRQLRNKQMQFNYKLESSEQYALNLSNEVKASQNRQIQYESEIIDKQTRISKLSNELVFLKGSFENLQESISAKDNNIQRLNAEINKLRIQEQQNSDILIQKQTLINKLQNQITRIITKSEQCSNQTQINLVQINKLNYQLNNIRRAYQQLQEQQRNNSSYQSSATRQISNLKLNLQNCEHDLSLKQSALQRYRIDVKDLTKQVETLHEQIYQKNNTINSLNQQIYRARIQTQDQANDEIHKLSTELSQQKYRISSIQAQLQDREQQIVRLKQQVIANKSNKVIQKYTDEEYQFLSIQYSQAQKSLIQVRSQISEKDLELAQLQGKIQSLKRLEADNKRRYIQQRNDLQKQLQTVLQRQRQLRNQIHTLQTQVHLTNNRTSDQREFGLQLYQQQCDRLTQITQDLTEQINGLKLKLTAMTNQQDRIVQNLTLMTLTFAEVQALRDRIKNKQNQISEVRKSLVNYASSSSDVNSRLILKDNIQQTFNANPSNSNNLNNLTSLSQNNRQILSLTQQNIDSRYSSYVKQNASEEGYNYAYQNQQPTLIQRDMRTVSSHGGTSHKNFAGSMYQEGLQEIIGGEGAVNSSIAFGQQQQNRGQIQYIPVQNVQNVQQSVSVKSSGSGSDANWRFGSRTSGQGVNQPQVQQQVQQVQQVQNVALPPPLQQQQQQLFAQQQQQGMRVNFGMNNFVNSAKAISPQPVPIVYSTNEYPSGVGRAVGGYQNFVAR